MNLANNILMSNSSEIAILEDECAGYKITLTNLQNEYKSWTTKKSDVVAKWCAAKMNLYKLKRIPLDSIARDIIHEMKQIGVSEGGIASIYDMIPKECKRNYSRGSAIRDANVGNPTLNNQSVEDEIEEELEIIEQKLSKLPESRKQRAITKVTEFTKKHSGSEDKEQDYGIHQAEPPKHMQGPSDFSQAVGVTAQWFKDASERFTKIQKEIEIYKPSDDAQKAKDWNECINLIVIGQILDPFFMTDTRAEADRKWSTSTFHWIEIIKERIRQSKHGAGKKAENYIIDPLGRIVYTKKKNPVKRGVTRERVGDAELPILNMALEVLRANSGMIGLHEWLEEDQGGYRRYRKDFLHEYFSEAALAGSLKSGNSEYAQYMASYKKRYLEKYA